MRVLVTGAAGFLGQHLVRRLKADGHEVWGLDVRPLPAECDAKILGDVRNRTPEIYPDLDRIYHLACPASPVDYFSRRIFTLETGVYGTSHVLRLAEAKRARLLIASTSEVYGDPQVHPQPEEYWGHVNPVGPRSCYDEAKRAAEALAMAYRHERGIDVRIARIHNTFGPGMRVDDGRLIPAFITQALRGAPLTVHAPGTQTRCLCYVDDMIDGLVRLMDEPEAGIAEIGNIVNLGNPTERSVLEIASYVWAAVYGPDGPALRHTFVPPHPDDPQRRRPVIARAHRLGWRPQTHIADGIRQTVAWFRGLAKEAA